MKKISKLLILGEAWIKPRSSETIYVLTREISHIQCHSEWYYFSTAKETHWAIRKIKQILGKCFYHIILPFNVAFCDCIYVLSSNNQVLPAARFWSLLFGKKIIVDLYVSLFETFCIDRDEIPQSSIYGRWLAFCDKLAICSDYPIHYSNIEYSHFKEFLNIPCKNNLSILPLFTDICVGDNQHKLNVQKNPDKFIFCWWGSLLPLHGLPLIFQAFQDLATENNSFELHLCFTNPEKIYQFQDLCQLKIEHKWLFLHADKTFSNGTLSEFVKQNVDICLGHFGTSSKAEYLITNKIIEAMSLGKAILTGKTEGIQEINNWDSLFYTCGRTPKEISIAAQKIMMDPEEVKSKGLLCIQEFENKYSPDSFAKNIVEIITEIEKSMK
jgi:glycosyltransferase involved in cell wall biosynthesis